MKKLTVFSVIVLAILAFSQASFAASYGKNAGQSYMVVVGTIVKIDKTKHFLVIKDKDDGSTYGISASASDIESLNQGDAVTATVPQPGNLAFKVTR